MSRNGQTSEKGSPVPASARPRVLVLTTTLPARQGDGTPEFVLWLAQALRTDFEIHLVAPRVRGANGSMATDGLVIRRFAYFPRRLEGVADEAILPTLRAQPWRVVEVPFLLARFWFAAFTTALRVRPSVIHAHWIVPAGVVALTLRWLLGIPYIVTVLGGDAYALNSPPMRFLKRIVIRNAHVVSPLSRDMGYKVGLPRDEVERVVVPLGVDVEAIERAVGQRRPDPGKFLFVGRLADKKGADVLLNAMARTPQARLVVLGDGPEAPALQALAQDLGIQDRVRFIGRQPRPRVMEELRTAYALVIPSTVGRGGDRDGTPLVMCEAMAARVPVIASSFGGLAEYIVSGETGLLVEPGSVPSLAAALQHALVSREELEAWASQARAAMNGVLDIQTTRERYRAFLESAVHRVRGRENES